MLTKPTEPELRALAQLKAPGMIGIVELLRRELASTDKVLRDTHDEVSLRQLQGRAKLLEEFLSTVDSSTETLEKLSRPKERGFV